MKTFAVIKDGVVENCIVADSKEIAETQTGLECIEYFSVVPGWSYVDGVFASQEVEGQ